MTACPVKLPSNCGVAFSAKPVATNIWEQVLPKISSGDEKFEDFIIFENLIRLLDMSGISLSLPDSRLFPWGSPLPRVLCDLYSVPGGAQRCCTMGPIDVRVRGMGCWGGGRATKVIS